ncbi:unnamed protein product [Pipistrellus nathusii]|uniref:Uncharacterized protein n=1 Tax=Pipistrellus nathusii TaxID=59473 RepID=A0ABN9ZR49_PIPNA
MRVGIPGECLVMLICTAGPCWERSRGQEARRVGQAQRMSGQENLLDKMAECRPSPETTEPGGTFRRSNEGLGGNVRRTDSSPGISGSGWLFGQPLFLLNSWGLLGSKSPLPTEDLFRLPYPTEDQEV